MADFSQIEPSGARPFGYNGEGRGSGCSPDHGRPSTALPGESTVTDLTARPMVRQGPASLYRLFGADGSLLYVGIAGNPGRRFEQHSKDKPWWSDVASVRLEHFPDRALAVAAEAMAIRVECPIHNVIHNRGRAVPPPNGEAMPEDRDRLSSVDDQPLTSTSLVGSYFHSRVDGKIKWQGCVVGEPSPGIYLVETFSWLMGDSCDQQLVSISDMAGWSFYDSAEWMQNAYRRHEKAS